ncbi:hypothetical protein KKF91_22020, partial [Myxococcota bacterium]|nr:hypothetical protein [Myxococcota bacterium]
GGGGGGIAGGGGGGIAGGGGDERLDSGVTYPEPTVIIERPIEGVLLLTLDVTVGGRLQDYFAEGGRVRAVVDGQEPGLPVQVDEGDRFSVDLHLEPGEHYVQIIAEQGGRRGVDNIAVRCDVFVTREGATLSQGGAPFRFMALSAPDLLFSAHFDNQAGVTSSVDEVFAEARRMGVTVVRTRAHDDRPDAPTAIQTAPGVDGEAGLAALDLIVDRAGAHGIKLILTLLDGGERYGGVMQYLRWAGYGDPQPEDLRRFFVEGPPRTSFENHVQALINRRSGRNNRSYRDDPAILGWEILDGFDGRGAFPDNQGNELFEFFDRIGQVIKANDINHLVGTGDMGFDVNPTQYGDDALLFDAVGGGHLFDGSHGTSWQRNIRSQYIDFATLHIDPTGLNIPDDPNHYANLGAAWVRSHAALAATNGKPLIITQARMNQLPLSLDQRKAALAAWLGEFSSRGVTGLSVGNYYPDNAQILNDAGAWGWRNGTDIADPGNAYAQQLSAAAGGL